MADRASTQAVDVVFTVFSLAALAVLLPTLLTILGLGVESAPSDVGDLLLLGFYGLIVVLILGIGAFRLRGGGR